MSDPNRKPTPEELEAADEYALSKLCVDIPSRFEAGLTTWDANMKKCRITKAGCESSPLSLKSFSPTGEILDYKKMNVSENTKKFWEVAPPEHLVYKLIKGSRSAVCARANYKLQQFCEFPRQRSSKNEGAFGSSTGKGYDVGPKFTYTTVNGEETCIIGKDYCDFKGVSYDSVNKQCYVPGAQKFGETIIGTTLIRMGQSGG
jgi:hypothetical protein